MDNPEHYADLACNLLRDIRQEINLPELRDRMAIAAMQGLLASCHGPAWGKDMFPLAESAYAYADAMLKARVTP